MENKLQWNDIKSATQHELKKIYKLSDRQLEGQLRNHLDGASSQERRQIYQELYGKRK